MGNSDTLHEVKRKTLWEHRGAAPTAVRVGRGESRSLHMEERKHLPEMGNVFLSIIHGSLKELKII